MRGISKVFLGLITLAGVGLGCESPQYVERVPVVAPDTDPRRGYDRPKPMPDQPGMFDHAPPASHPLPPSVDPDRK